ncbi:hypothetical protein ACFYOD_06995 [Streptomyces sp. NPDC006703]|uniref:hypothetical protein n=1 Tax=Streptomyces sp. NPDC006703 TaxID=3364759 RepID=UPI0036B17A74
MALTDKDPHNLRETLRVMRLSAQAAKRQGRGKSIKRIENEIDRVRETAQAREDTRRKH